MSQQSSFIKQITCQWLQGTGLYWNVLLDRCNFWSSKINYTLFLSSSIITTYTIVMWGSCDSLFLTQLLAPKSRELRIHLIFTCSLFPDLKLMLGLVLCRLLSVLFGIHSLNMLRHQIVYFIPSSFENSLFRLAYPSHVSTPSNHLLMNFALYLDYEFTQQLVLGAPCTELDSFWGSWRNRSFVIIIIIKKENVWFLLGLRNCKTITSAGWIKANN